MNSALLLATAEGGVQWGDFLFYLCTFLILIALVKHFAWGPVTEMMEKRADKIANDIDSAETARKKRKSSQLNVNQRLRILMLKLQKSLIVQRRTVNSKKLPS